MEHRDSETCRNLIFRRLKTSLLFNVIDLLKCSFFEDETVESSCVLCVQILDVILTVEKLRVVHPAEAGHMTALKIVVLVEELQLWLLCLAFSGHGSTHI